MPDAIVGSITLSKDFADGLSYAAELARTMALSDSVSSESAIAFLAFFKSLNRKADDIRSNLPKPKFRADIVGNQSKIAG